MRVPIIAGNWKMHTTYDEALDLVEEIVEGLDGHDEGAGEVVLCPPFPWLPVVAEYLDGTGIALGAQNCNAADAGALTGEVSAAMLAQQCRYVIVGHSERRQHFGETDADVAAKAAAALRHGLRPIICVGEDLATRDAGDADTHIAAQVGAAFAAVDARQLAECIVAYEPLWAIGSGRAADGAAAAWMAGVIRAALAARFDAAGADLVRVQYGGSVTDANIADFLGQPGIDGALVGGASLKTGVFVRLCLSAVGRRQAAEG